MVEALYLVLPVLATPTRSFIPNSLLGLANPDCIDIGIDPPIPTPSASFVSSPFFYVHDGPDCIDFSIASSHNSDCLSTSVFPLCTYSSIDMAT